MSILSWLFGKSKPLPQLGGLEAARMPPSGAVAGTPAPPAGAPRASMTELKKLRQDRRDHLYRVVRDVMLRSEVLASTYKFKVLSLDTQGQQFLVMVDLLGDTPMGGQRLADIENQVSAMAMQRHKLLVKAVYWRQAATVSAATAATPTTPTTSVVTTPASTASSQPAAPGPAPAPVPFDQEAPTPRGRGGAKPVGFEPIGQDEVLAFKKAIGGAPAPATTPGQPQVSGLRNAAAMSGFEDTQLLEPDESASPLSRTQFGDFN